MSDGRRLFTAAWMVVTLSAGAWLCEPAAAQRVHPLVEDQVIVRLQPGTDIGPFNQQYETTTLRTIPGRDLYLLDIPDGQPVDPFAAMLRSDPRTVFAEGNYEADAPEGSGRNFYCSVIPQNTFYVFQPAWQQINLATAQQQSSGQGVNVAVVDTGLDVTHSVFAGRVLPGGWNFRDLNGGSPDIRDIGDGVDNDMDGTIDEMVGHGTHMSGVIAFIAPDTKILPIKVLDSDGNTTNFHVAQGIFYAIDQGVDVINVSISSTYDSKAVEDALDEAVRGGIFVAAAGGNVNSQTPEYPALNDGALGTAAVDQADIRASFSNYSPSPPLPQMNLSAPGVHVWSTIPGNMYADLDGTSPATAMVSGTAALLIAAHPEWQRDEGRVSAITSALSLSAFNIDPLNPGFEGRLGEGRLDAGAALNRNLGVSPPRFYPSGANPSGVSLGDLNGDQLADLAVANTDSNNVAVLINHGDGTFAAAAHYAVGGGPTAVVAVDLNGDQAPDLALANGNAGSVSVLINNGDGTFAAARNYATGAGPTAIVAANLDGDSDNDLATADEDGNSVSILRNDGTGAFTRSASYTVGDRPRDLVAARLNADARPDLAVVSRNSDDLHVLMNRGDATFDAPRRYVVGASPRGVSAVDANGDGSVDLVSANSETRDLSVLDNRGDGTFNAARSLPLFANRSADALVPADFNCDQIADLAVINGDPPGALMSMVFGDGQGGFPGKFDVAINGVPEDLDAGDLNGDLEPDIAVVDSGSGGVWVILNRSCRRYGDLNCDDTIDAFDIEPFILAVFDAAEYARQYPNCERVRADVNGDGLVDAFDIQPFVELLFGP